jgi:hypothetical protein
MKSPLLLSTVLVCLTALIITYMVMKPVYECLESINPDGLKVRQHVACIHGT